MNKQLKIWKEDFLRYYGRTSILVRILIGAALSFAAAYILIHKVIKPQNGELKKLKQKYQAMEVIDDADIQVADLKNKQRKASSQLTGLVQVNEQLAEKMGSLRKEEVGKNILELRYQMDRHSLRIVSEERIVPDRRKTIRRGKNRKNQPDTRVKISFPASMSCESYKFEVLGSYINLRKFFMDVKDAQALFFLNNITIGRSREMLTDKNLNQYRALSCSFEVHVPYQDETKKKKKEGKKK